MREGNVTLVRWSSDGHVESPLGAAQSCRAFKGRGLCFELQVRFYEVPEEELEVARSDFASGKFPLEVSEEEFDFAAHADFCESKFHFS